MERGGPFTEQDTAGGVPRRRRERGLRQEVLRERRSPGAADHGRAADSRGHEARAGRSNGRSSASIATCKNGGPKGDGFPEIDVPFAQSPWPGATVAVRTGHGPGQRRQGHRRGRSGPSTPTCPWPTSRPWTSSSTKPWPATVSSGSLRKLRGRRAAPGRPRDLRRHVVRGGPATARDRPAHGPGRRPGQVLRQILQEGMGTALIGIGFGSVGAYFVGRAMQGMWYGVGVMDPWRSPSWRSLLASAMLACLVPARRAASVDPMTALRSE